MRSIRPIAVLRSRHQMPAYLTPLLAALALLACTPSPALPGPTATAPLAATPRVEATAQASTATPSPGPTPAPPPEVTIAFVGDLMLARRVTTLMQEHGALYPFERVLPLFEGADLLVGNLEGTFTGRGVAMEKRYTFRTPPVLAEGLARAGFDALSLANNHMYDFGVEGLEDTLATLDAAGIAGFGAGMTEAEARAPVVLEANGLRVALLSYNEVWQVRFADGETPGVALAAPETIAEDVGAALDGADFVVVVVHWGIEYSHEPTAGQRELAAAAIGAGASAVVGHHPHVLQPWERVGEGLVLYSLGNFVFDLDLEDLEELGAGAFQTAVALVTLRAGAPPQVEFRPAFIDPVENRPRPPSDEEAGAIRGLLRELR